MLGQSQLLIPTLGINQSSRSELGKMLQTFLFVTTACQGLSVRGLRLVTVVSILS